MRTHTVFSTFYVLKYFCNKKVKIKHVLGAIPELANLLGVEHTGLHVL